MYKAIEKIRIANARVDAKMAPVLQQIFPTRPAVRQAERAAQLAMARLALQQERSRVAQLRADVHEKRSEIVERRRRLEEALTSLLKQRQNLDAAQSLRTDLAQRLQTAQSRLRARQRLLLSSLLAVVPVNPHPTEPDSCLIAQHFCLPNQPENLGAVPIEEACAALATIALLVHRFAHYLDEPLPYPVLMSGPARRVQAPRTGQEFALSTSASEPDRQAAVTLLALNLQELCDRLDITIPQRLAPMDKQRTSSGGGYDPPPSLPLLLLNFVRSFDQPQAVRLAHTAPTQVQPLWRTAVQRFLPRSLAPLLGTAIEHADPDDTEWELVAPVVPRPDQDEELREFLAVFDIKQ
eukprot:TRINITY_DN7010_c0_g1_i1.p1 TRINITY_DN7010_c0_g1~~TRINITY_DN7010_c0_g1_i1.p1  ORF type:complete len:384 (+),score=55.91 TRINITY_DN7010_c0_g1_i1:99-1154(+)